MNGSRRSQFSSSPREALLFISAIIPSCQSAIQTLISYSFENFKGIIYNIIVMVNAKSYPALCLGAVMTFKESEKNAETI